MSLTIVTIDSPQQKALKTKTEDFRADEFRLARKIADQLVTALTPHFPAAGLAAPQIGIGRSIFIYSFDRDPNNLKAVINPSLQPIGDEIVEGWEGCFSAILSNGTWKVAKLPRYERIKAVYFNLNGEKEELVLEGFAAKVFQHEYDHLQGIVCVCREGVEVKTFDTKEALLAFMQAVKKEDATRYKKPK